MSCRETPGGSAAITMARAQTGASERDAQRAFHAVKRQFGDLPAPSAAERNAWADTAVERAWSLGLPSSQAQSLQQRINEAREFPVDGRTFAAMQKVSETVPRAARIARVDESGRIGGGGTVRPENRLTEKREARFRELNGQGLTAKAIADEMGISQQRVAEWRDILGLTNTTVPKNVGEVEPELGRATAAQVRRVVAPITDPDRLDRLSRHKVARVRTAVARVGNLSLIDDQHLATDSSKDVRRYLTENPTASPEALDMLYDEHPEAVLNHPQTSDETVIRGINDPAFGVEHVGSRRRHCGRPSDAVLDEVRRHGVDMFSAWNDWLD